MAHQYQAKTALGRVVNEFEETAIAVILGIMTVITFVNVVLRYGFNYTLAWSEELVREVIIYTTFIGLAVAIKNGQMIKIDALVQLVPKLKIPLSYFSNLVTIIFAVMMLYFGWKMAALQVATHQKTIILEIPLVYLYAILPLMGATMLIRTIQVLYKDINEQFFERSAEE